MPPPRGAAFLGYNIQYAWLEYFSISFFFGIVATVPLARRLLMMMTFAKESKTKQIIWLCSCGCGCFLWLWLCLWPCGTRRRPCGTRRTTKSPEIVKKICLTKKHKKSHKKHQQSSKITRHLQKSPENYSDPRPAQGVLKLINFKTRVLKLKSRVLKLNSTKIIKKSCPRPRS